MADGITEESRDEEMEIRLCDTENLKIPEQGLISGSGIRNIMESLACIISEYMISVLHMDPSDEQYYPYIRKYFEGEYRAKELLHKLLSHQETADFFHIIPELIHAKFDPCIWKKVLENISIEIPGRIPGETDDGTQEEHRTSIKNQYRIGTHSFVSEQYFFHVYAKEDSYYAQKYFLPEPEGQIYFCNIGDEEVRIEAHRPFRFDCKERKAERPEGTWIEEQDFFQIEEIRSTDQEQQAVIRAGIEKNLVVLAGAGSGKTRTLVSRLAYLHLVRGIPLSRIVLLTFTVSAAAEMQARAEQLIRNIYCRTSHGSHPYVYTRTFDSFFRKILLDYFMEIGFTEVPVLDLGSEDMTSRLRMMEEVIVDHQMQGIFSSYLKDENGRKNLLMQMENYGIGLTVNQPGVDRLLELFLDRQIARNTVLGFLYVNLLVKRALWQEHSLLREALSHRYSCFLIDEFQDISILQNDTMKVFYDSEIHFTFVGDDDQSIYAWRGADVSIIQEIVNRKHTDTKYLMINYRNNPNIVKAGNCILKLIDHRAKKHEILPYKTHGAKIRVARNDSKYTNLADEIDRLIQGGCVPGEISVLARKRRQADMIIEALTAINIPVATQETPVQPDIYYYLMKALLNILSDYNIYASCREIMRYAKADGYTEMQIYRIIHGEIQGTGNLEVIQHMAAEMNRPGALQLAAVVERYMEAAGEEFDRLIFGKTANKTLEAFADYCRDCEAPWPLSHKQLISIYSIFEHNAGKRRPASIKHSQGVSVNTIHSAKGLEYNVVMIVGLNTGEYPNLALIDYEYSRNVQELEQLKNARKEYYELRKTIRDTRVPLMIAECRNPALTEEEREHLHPLAEYMRKNQRNLGRLGADAVDGFIEVYHQHVLPLEKEYNFEQAACAKKILDLQSLLTRKQEESVLLQEEDQKAQNQEERHSLKEELEHTQKYLDMLKKKAASFGTAVSSMKSFHNIAFIASGLLADMGKAEEVETIRHKLEQQRKIKIAEERRTFYVGVTRARDHLYLFSDETAEESEFIRDISGDLKHKYTVLTGNEWKEFHRLSQGLHQEVLKKPMDEEKVDEAISRVVEASVFQSHIKEKMKEYLNEQPVFAGLPKEAARYFRQGMSLLFVGELTGTDFVTEFSHNIQKTAESILEDAAGEHALPFLSSDPREIEVICKKIHKAASLCESQIPSKKFIEDLISREYEGSRMDSLKKAGIQHYMVRSGAFKIRKTIQKTWRIQRLQGEPEAFLGSVLDLANIRNILVHEKENRWPEDAVTAMLNHLKVIIKSSCQTGV